MYGNEDDEKALQRGFSFAGLRLKAKVALEAIRGDLTLAELGTKHGIHHTMIAAWKRQAIDGMASTFAGASEVARASGEAEIDKLHSKIGQLVVERDFLAKAFGR
jgi:transposase